MIIREEKQQDFPAVDALIRSAFAHAAHSDGTERLCLRPSIEKPTAEDGRADT